MNQNTYAGIPRLGQPQDATYKYFCDMAAWRTDVVQRLAPLGLNPRRDPYEAYARLLIPAEKAELDGDTMRRWFQLRYMGDALPVTAPLALVAVFDTAVKRATRR